MTDHNRNSLYPGHMPSVQPGDRDFIMPYGATPPHHSTLGSRSNSMLTPPISPIVMRNSVINQTPLPMTPRGSSAHTQPFIPPTSPPSGFPYVNHIQSQDSYLASSRASNYVSPYPPSNYYPHPMFPQGYTSSTYYPRGPDAGDGSGYVYGDAYMQRDDRYYNSCAMSGERPDPITGMNGLPTTGAGYALSNGYNAGGWLT